MINGVVRFIKTLLTLVVKGTAWLLFTLGLWLPCLFCIVFLIVCAFSGVSLTTVMRGFIIGLTLSVIGGLIISYYIEDQKRKRAQAIKNSERIKRAEARRLSGKGVPPVGNGLYTDGQDGYSLPRERAGFRKDKNASKKEQSFAQDALSGEQAQTTNAAYSNLADGAVETEVNTFASNVKSEFFPSANGFYQNADKQESKSFQQADSNLASNGEDLQRSWNRAEQRCEEESASALREKYFYSGNSLLENSDSGLRYDYEGAAQKKLQRIQEGDGEQPLIFKSKYYRDIYIYEFSDRLHIYRRTPQGMVLVEVRDKRGAFRGGQD